MTSGAIDNTAMGLNALQLDQTGFRNTAIGFNALLNNLQGNDNTAAGYQALFSNTTINGTSGSQNTATGYRALAQNTTGNLNTAVGFQALVGNQNAGANRAVGADALPHNTVGNYNTANGVNALYFSNGNYNTALGVSACGGTTLNGRSHNTGIGALALQVNNGSENTATGYAGLQSNTAGDHNTATGTDALQKNTVGRYNTATGASALGINTDGNFNTADGVSALFFTTGSNNIALGAASGLNLSTGDNNIDIGNQGANGESDTIRIGTEGIQGGPQGGTYVAGIVNEPVGANAAPVLIDSTGKLGTAVGSSKRFKKEIKSMEDASKTILSLRPVTFHYKTDTKGTRQFGLIAEEVAKVDPALVLRDKEGKPYTVRYDAVNAMLLNEFLKEHKKVQEQQAIIAQLKSIVVQQRKRFAKQEEQIEALTSGLQKVSAQLATRKEAQRVAANR